MAGQASSLNQYDVFNAYMNAGWPAVLSRRENNVWMVYLQRAAFSDGSCTAYPGIEEITEKTGIPANHVRSARAALVAHGLLELVQAGDNHAKTAAVYRVLMPPEMPATAPEDDDASQNGTRPKSGRMEGSDVPNRDASDGAMRPDSGASCVPNRDVHASQIGTHNHSYNHPLNHPVGDASQNGTRPKSGRMEDDRPGGEGRNEGTAGQRRRSRSRVSAGEPPGFTRFWATYPDNCPRKRDKAGCLKIWLDQQLENVADQVLAGLEGYKRGRDWLKDDGAYIAEPIRFLRKAWWRTPPPPARGCLNGGGVASSGSITKPLVFGET